MKQGTFNILFFLSSRPKKNGEHSIMLRITVNGHIDQISVNRSIDRKVWNQVKGSSKGKDRNSLEINSYIADLRARINSIYKDLLLAGAYITPISILAKLFNREVKETFLKMMRKEIERMELLIGIDYEKVTLNRYWNCFRCVSEVVQLFYNKDDIAFSELTPDFVSRLDFYYKKEKKIPLCHNTIVKYMKCLKRIVNIAIEKGLLKNNPFVGSKYVQEETDPVFLTKEELLSIENKEFEIEKLRVVKDMFVFCCYTGLAFTDTKELSYSDLFTDNKGNIWIRKARHKIKRNKARCTANVPLLEPAIRILEKYKEHPKCKEEGVCLPVFSNATVNVYLKDIASLCGINKNLTTHTARHVKSSFRLKMSSLQTYFS